MGKFRKGQGLVCVPCGREVIVNSCGISQRTIWCCNKPMKQKRKASKSRKASTRTKKRK